MPIASYKFTRNHRNISGFFSQNTVITDVLIVLTNWKYLDNQRNFEILKDTENSPWISLKWEDSDINAGLTLDIICNNWGVERVYQDKLTAKNQ